MKFFSVIFFMLTSICAQSSLAPDTSDIKHSSPITQSDSVAKTTDSIKIHTEIVSPKKDSVPFPKKILDSTFRNGVYAGIGVGWSLGNFDAEQLWEKTLPGALKDIHLNEKTLVILPDTTQTDSLLRSGDTSSLRFSIKDKPSTYNMMFPISLSLTKYRKNDRFSTALAFSLFSKNQKSSISMLNDSLSRRIDLRQKFLLYSVSLHFMYAKRIDPIYFSIDGIDRTDLLLGVSITPLMRMKTSGSTKRFSSDFRTIGVDDTIKKQIINNDSYGFSMSLRTGISTTQRFSTGALEIQLLYSLSWNDYFYHNGNRVYRGTLNKGDSEGDQPLSFLSNRLEINFSLLRKLGKNRSNETEQP